MGYFLSTLSKINQLFEWAIFCRHALRSINSLDGLYFVTFIRSINSLNGHGSIACEVGSVTWHCSVVYLMVVALLYSQCVVLITFLNYSLFIHWSGLLV